MTADFLCDRLRFLRNERGISARELSLSLGQNETYINKIETKQSSPSIDSFFKICDFFKITPSQFFNENCKNTIEDDEEILKVFRSLPKDQAKHFFEIMRFVSKK